jgi:hypothetical protein
MTMRARIGDLVFEVETEADLRLLLRAAKDAGTSEESSIASETVSGRLRRCYASLRSDGQRSVIRALASAPDGLTDNELRAVVEVKNNVALAGLMAGISRHAKKAGLKLEQVLVKQVLREGDAKYRFRLTPDMLEVAGGTPHKTLV